MSIRLEKLEIAAGGRKLLGSLDLSFAAASRTAILGVSGTGKTTLLRTIAGLQVAASGRVWIDDQLVTDGARVPVAPHRRGLAMVFQDLGLWPHLTVSEHLRFAAGPQAPADWLQELVAVVGLDGLQKRRPASLSGGEQQRLALIRALASRPRRLLLDEPFTSLDLVLRQGLCELVDELQRRYGFTLLLVTHDPLEALRLAERVILLGPGEILWDGPAGEFRSAQTEQLADLNRALERWTAPVMSGRR